MQIRLLKWLDSVVGGLLAACLPAVPTREAAVRRRFLLIRPGGIGDAVLLIPAILALKERFPDARITVLAERRNGAAFALCSAVDQLLLYDSLADLTRAIRGGYDVVIDTEQWHRLSAVVARLTRAPMVVGFASNDRSKLFTHHVRYSHDDCEIDSFFNLLVPVGINSQSDFHSHYLTVPLSSAQKADELLGEFATGPFVTIFPGASIPERRWGAHNFMDLAESLHEKGIPLVVIGGREDSSDGERIAARGYGLNLAGKTSIVETAAIINRSSLLISGDSGILHIGVGLGKPTVSMFGPGIAKKWAPRGDIHIVINKYLPCSPCTKFGYTSKCPINAKCMSDITLDEVVQGVELLMRKTATKMVKEDRIKTSKQIP